MTSAFSGKTLCIESFLCCWKRVFAMTSAFSGKTLLAFALLHSLLQGQICLLLQVCLDFLFFIPVFCNEKDIFFGCQFQKIMQNHSQNHSTSAPSALLVGAQTWINVIITQSLKCSYLMNISGYTESKPNSVPQNYLINIGYSFCQELIMIL